MNNPRLDTALRELGVPDYVDRAGQAALARMIASEQTGDTEQPNPERLPRIGFLYESQGIAAYQRWVVNQGEDELREAREYFLKSFTCWRALILLPEGNSSSLRSDISQVGVQLIHSELHGEPLPPELTLAFRLGLSGLLSTQITETRLELKRFSLSSFMQTENWREQVTEHVFNAFVRLIRKADGWNDIDLALKSINKLRQLQKDYEDVYLDSQGDTSKQTIAALELVGLYHLAQMVTLTGEYLRDGTESIAQVNSRLDRHRERALTAFKTGQRPLLSHIVDLFWVGCRELARNAIWTHVNGLGEAARDFAKLLVDRGRPHPVIELWPSQQEALRRNLLDPYRRAILVEMPTSAGKTLLAKFAIVQTKALNPNGNIAYVVPTRALVNQITFDLRADFRKLRISVEQAVPAYELDPTEERLLESAPDVLVTTPEKLDLLIRSEHPVTRDIALVVADEAHNICEEGRGPRLELLLGTIKRDRPGARFLLLSPFLPNSEELVSWLGEGRALPPISVDWKPGRKLVGAVKMAGRGKQRKLIFETLPASDNTDVRPGIQIPIASGTTGIGKTITSLTRATVQAMLERGSILVLCRGRGTAMERAQQIASNLPLINSSPQKEQKEAVCRYLEAEVGRKSNLVECLRHGVAYHHAGLSHESRWLVEGLIRRGDVKVICGTTTLAQGVNFPITTVIVETLKKGPVKITYQDFWNIAGRAGRALVDTIGVVAFPTENPTKHQRCVDFLQEESLEISSQLATLIKQADQIANQFDIQALYNWPQLSSLLQFLAHAMRVSGSDNVADDIEDILRASLVYHQALRQDDEDARRLVRLCRSYLEQIRGKSGLLTLADKTGFATPSVLELLRRTRNDLEFTTPANWQPDRLFSDDLQPLRQRVEAIAELPEIQLGQGTQPPFNAERIAAILRDWVQGETLESLAQQHLVPAEPDPDKRVAKFSSYLFSQLLGRASWGIGALEGICLAGMKNQAQWEEVGYIPSMIFFGVQRKEAIWLRMVGVPRLVADGLAQIWQQKNAQEPGTYEDIRNWVSQLTNEDWQQAIPGGTSLTPEDMRLIWQEFL